MTRWPHEQLPIHGPTLNRVLEDFFRRATPQAEVGEEEVVQSTWTPAVDVKETDDSLQLYVELPGVNKGEIDISLENNVLTVGGERHFEEHERESYRRVERAYGKFSRSFRVPRDVDGNKVTAAYTDGILRLELPKVEAAKPRQIEIV